MTALNWLACVSKSISSTMSSNFCTFIQSIRRMMKGIYSGLFPRDPLEQLISIQLTRCIKTSLVPLVVLQPRSMELRYLTMIHEVKWPSRIWRLRLLKFTCLHSYPTIKRLIKSSHRLRNPKTLKKNRQ